MRPEDAPPIPSSRDVGRQTGLEVLGHFLGLQQNQDAERTARVSRDWGRFSAALSLQGIPFPISRKDFFRELRTTLATKSTCLSEPEGRTGRTYSASTGISTVSSSGGTFEHPQTGRGEPEGGAEGMA